jgi:hypothetical protein
VTHQSTTLAAENKQQTRSVGSKASSTMVKILNGEIVQGWSHAECLILALWKLITQRRHTGSIQGAPCHASP